jgi:hypothetical protein
MNFKMYQHYSLQHIFLKPFSQSKGLFMYLIICVPNKCWTFDSQGHTVAQILSEMDVQYLCFRPVIYKYNH